jgi:hypothetical protein
VQGPKPEGWITDGCLGKNSDGKLESPAVGSKADAARGGGMCLTWKPRKTFLEMLPSVKINVEVKRGTTVKVELFAE